MEQREKMNREVREGKKGRNKKQERNEIEKQSKDT